MSTAKSAAVADKKKRRAKFKRYLPVYIMALPGLIYLFINNYMPLPGLVLAFKNYSARKGDLWIGLGGLCEL